MVDRRFALRRAWAVAGIVLAPPLGGFVMGLTILPAVVVGFCALRGTLNDSTYRTLHRFSPAAKRLLLLYFLLGMTGVVVIVRFGSEPPHRAHFGPLPRPFSAAEDFTNLVDSFRVVAGVVLLVYALVGLLVLVRMHYRPVSRR